ncbi:MAG: type II toxin-antitoxin system VapC family toxin [Candidatus Sulfotelmatobacter sp.]
MWVSSGDPRLSTKAQTAIQEARQTVRGLAISDFTLVELSQLYRKNRIALAIGPEDFLRELERRFVILPITANIALQAYALPASYPKDPADRIIGATALIEDIPLLTADRANGGRHSLVDFPLRS